MLKTFEAVQEDMYDLLKSEPEDFMKKIEVRLFVLHYLLGLENVDNKDIEGMLKCSYANYDFLAEEFKKNYKGGNNGRKIFQVPRRPDSIN